MSRVPSFIFSSGHVQLQPAPITPAWIVEGNPVARAAVLSRSPDGFASSMMWECTPGKFDWFYTSLDETLQILRGALILDQGLPTEQPVGVGDTLYFPAGSKARWTITETVYKVAFLRRPLPEAVTPVITALRGLKARLHGGNATQGDSDPFKL